MAMPSPVYRWSEKMMWPDCSPPIDRSRLSISSMTYLSPTGQRISSMSLALSASSRPMLLMTVATTALPFSTALRTHVPRAQQQHGVAVHDSSELHR